MYLITPSLLNSWLWYTGYTPDNEEKQNIEDAKFVSVLNRVESDPSPSMLFGQEFEDDVRFGKPTRPGEEYLNYVRKVSKKVEGGTWQMPCKKQYKDFLLYGRMDVVKGNTIFDIKTTSFYDVGKFKYSAQHKLYLYCTGLEKCTYIIAEVYHGKESVTFKSLCEETYTERDIESVVDEFVEWLELFPQYKTLYYDNWKCKNGSTERLDNANL